jgi:hypothetical protein
MASVMGHDFSGIRAHAGSDAAASAAALGANAFTVGRHIIFGAGNYERTTTKGWGLIAHELAHAAQQPGSRPVHEYVDIAALDHLDELEARINNYKGDPAKIRTIVEDAAKVRSRMQAELNEAAARFPQFSDPAMQTRCGGDIRNRGE